MSLTNCPKIILHPRLANRTDWFAWDTDTFGTTGNYKNPRQAQYKNTKDTNEVDFEDGINLRDAAGIVAHSQDQVEHIKSIFKANGKEEINGIPLDDFVVYQPHHMHSKKELIAKSIKGLQEGVLP